MDLQFYQWKLRVSVSVLVQNYLTLLDDEDHTLESLKIQDEQQLVIEGKKTHSVIVYNRISATKSSILNC